MNMPQKNPQAFEFTKEQQRIMNHPPFEDGRILAGPGTGKSTTAVALANELLGRDPTPRIKFLTFTRAATNELSKKIAASEMYIESASTIHSFSISALLRNPGSATFPTPLRIPDSYEQRELIDHHLAQKVGVNVLKLRKLINEMSAKWESLEEIHLEEVSPEERARFMGTWGQHRNIFGYTLLAELPDLFRQALINYDDLVGIDYELLLVDEYQDLNACDLEILKLLSDKGVSILAIGDDDQSIYSFRKAHPIGIRNFTDEYAVDEQYDYHLTICQRSPRLIFNWAQYVILGSPDRDPGRPSISFAERAPDGTCALLKFANEAEEAKTIADIITWLHGDKKMPLSDMLVLYRTDTVGKVVIPKIREILQERYIETSDPTVIRELLGITENRRLLSILHLISNPTDSLAWWALISLTRGLGDSFVNAVYDLAYKSNTDFGQALSLEAEKGFINCPARSRTLASSLWAEISGILQNLQLEENPPENWGAWIQGEIQAERLPSCTPEFLELLLSIGSEIAEHEEVEDLDRFLSQIEPKAKDLFQSQSNGVRFMSMRGSKGLTVKTTIVVGVDNDIIPLPRGDQNEERRLLYVAMTRSTEYLFMTWAARRAGPSSYAGRENFGRRQPSEFLRGGPVISQDGTRYVHRLTTS